MRTLVAAPSIPLSNLHYIVFWEKSKRIPLNYCLQNWLHENWSFREIQSIHISIHVHCAFKACKKCIYFDENEEHTLTFVSGIYGRWMSFNFTTHLKNKNKKWSKELFTYFQTTVVLKISMGLQDHKKKSQPKLNCMPLDSGIPYWVLCRLLCLRSGCLFYHFTV